MRVSYHVLKGAEGLSILIPFLADRETMRAGWGKNWMDEKALRADRLWS
jgi:hypothetical protein